MLKKTIKSKISCQKSLECNSYKKELKRIKKLPGVSFAILAIKICTEFLPLNTEVQLNFNA